MQIQELGPLDGVLIGHTIAWYEIPRDRIREKELKPREIRFGWYGQIAEEVKNSAIRTLKQQRKNCEAVRVTVLFRTIKGVEHKVSYLAEREEL